MATPTQKDISAYKGNDLTLIWDFVDKETGNDIPVIDTYDEVRFIIYTDEDNPIYEANLDSGFTVSGNRISCIISDTENDAIARKVSWCKLIIKIGEIDKTFQVGRYFVYDKKQGAQTDTGFTLNIDNTTQVTSIETSGLYAEALAYVSNLNRASIQPGDAGKIERIKEDESGWENVTASEAGIATKEYVDDKASLLATDGVPFEEHQKSKSLISKSFSSLPRNRTYILAHRGRERAPELTIIAMQQLPKHCAGVEIDLRLTSDGVPILMHDATVERTTDGTGNVSALTLSEIKALDAGSWYNANFAGAKVPTLEEYLIACREMNFKVVLMHLKDWSISAIEAYKDVVYSTGTQDIAFFAPDLGNVVTDIRNVDEHVRIACMGYQESKRVSIMAAALATGTELIFLTANYTPNKHYIPEIKEAGILSGASVINQPAEVHDAIRNYGVEFILTDYPSYYLNYVKNV